MHDNNDTRSGRKLVISNITTKLEALKGKGAQNSQVDAIIQKVLDLEEKAKNSEVDLSDSDIELIDMMLNAGELALQREESLQTILAYRRREKTFEEFENANSKIGNLYDKNLQLIKSAILNRLRSYGIRISDVEADNYFAIKATTGYFHNKEEYGKEIDTEEKEYRAFEYSTEVTINSNLSLDLKQQMIRALNETSEWFQQDAVLIKGVSKQTELDSTYYPGTPKVITSGDRIAHIIDTVEFDLDLVDHIFDIEKIGKANIDIKMIRSTLSDPNIYRIIVRILAKHGFYGGTFTDHVLNLAFIPKFDDRSFSEWHDEMILVRQEIIDEVIRQINLTLGKFSGIDFNQYIKLKTSNPYKFDILVGYNGSGNWAEGYFTPYEQLKGDSNEATDLRKQIVVELEN